MTFQIAAMDKALKYLEMLITAFEIILKTDSDLDEFSMSDDSKIQFIELSMDKLDSPEGYTRLLREVC